MTEGKCIGLSACGGGCEVCPANDKNKPHRLTNDEWKKVEEAMEGRYGIVEVAINHDLITLERCQKGKNRLAIFIYVNGHFKGDWIRADAKDPEIEYLRLTRRYLYSTKYRHELLRLQKKMNRQRFKELMDEWGCVEANRKINYRTPFFNDVSQIRRQYEKTFKDIKLVSINGQPQ